MLYRKIKLSTFGLYLKAVSKLWLVPLLTVNVLVPVISAVLYKNGGAGAESDIVTVMYFLLPISTVWTSIFVSEFFFSDRTRDVLFFYGRKKRFAVSQLFFLLPLVNVAAVTLLHFRCLSYSVSMAVNLLCIGVLFYGIAMLILRLSGSATMAVLALLLYELLNEFAMSDAFVFYKVYGSLTVEIFLRALCAAAGDRPGVYPFGLYHQRPRRARRRLKSKSKRTAVPVHCGFFCLDKVLKYCYHLYIEYLCNNGKETAMKISKELSTGTLPMLVLSVLGERGLVRLPDHQDPGGPQRQCLFAERGHFVSHFARAGAGGLPGELLGRVHRTQEKILPHYKERAQAAGEQKGGVHRFLRHGTESIVICIKGNGKENEERRLCQKGHGTDL